MTQLSWISVRLQSSLRMSQWQLKINYTSSPKCAAPLLVPVVVNDDPTY